MSTPRVSIWPDDLPPQLAALPKLVADHLHGSTIVTLADVSAAGASGFEEGLIVITDVLLMGGHAVDAILEELASLAPRRIDMVFVVGDGYLGTEGAHQKHAAGAAATVSFARSLATRRDTMSRANVVCIPDSLLGRRTVQRSPIDHAVDASDIASTIGYLLNPSGNYVNGQVIYVDGGRHLFSSQTA